MTSIEKKMLGAFVALFVLFLGSCAALVHGVGEEFAGCEGLQGVVDQVWTGKRCDGTDS